MKSLFKLSQLHLGIIEALTYFLNSLEVID